MPFRAEFAALFCTAQKLINTEPVLWKASLVQWIPANVQWKASPVQWKDQLRAVESWSSHHNRSSQFLEAVLCFSAIRF